MAKYVYDHDEIAAAEPANTVTEHRDAITYSEFNDARRDRTLDPNRLYRRFWPGSEALIGKRSTQPLRFQISAAQEDALDDYVERTPTMGWVTNRSTIRACIGLAEVDYALEGLDPDHPDTPMARASLARTRDGLVARLQPLDQHQAILEAARNVVTAEFVLSVKRQHEHSRVTVMREHITERVRAARRFLENPPADRYDRDESPILAELARLGGQDGEQRANVTYSLIDGWQAANLPGTLGSPEGQAAIGAALRAVNADFSGKVQTRARDLAADDASLSPEQAQATARSQLIDAETEARNTTTAIDADGYSLSIEAHRIGDRIGLTFTRLSPRQALLDLVKANGATIVSTTHAEAMTLYAAARVLGKHEDEISGETITPARYDQLLNDLHRTWGQLDAVTAFRQEDGTILYDRNLMPLWKAVDQGTIGRGSSLDDVLAFAKDESQRAQLREIAEQLRLGERAAPAQVIDMAAARAMNRAQREQSNLLVVRPGEGVLEDLAPDASASDDDQRAALDLYFAGRCETPEFAAQLATEAGRTIAIADEHTLPPATARALGPLYLKWAAAAAAHPAPPAPAARRTPADTILSSIEHDGSQREASADQIARLLDGGMIEQIRPDPRDRLENPEGTDRTLHSVVYAFRNGADWTTLDSLPKNVPAHLDWVRQTLDPATTHLLRRRVMSPEVYADLPESMKRQARAVILLTRARGNKGADYDNLFKTLKLDPRGTLEHDAQQALAHIKAEIARDPRFRDTVAGLRNRTIVTDNPVLGRALHQAAYDYAHEITAETDQRVDAARARSPEDRLILVAGSGILDGFAIPNQRDELRARALEDHLLARWDDPTLQTLLIEAAGKRVEFSDAAIANKIRHLATRAAEEVTVDDIAATLQRTTGGRGMNLHALAEAQDERKRSAVTPLPDGAKATVRLADLIRARGGNVVVRLTRSGCGTQQAVPMPANVQQDVGPIIARYDARTVARAIQAAESAKAVEVDPTTLKPIAPPPPALSAAMMQQLATASATMGY